MTDSQEKALKSIHLAMAELYFDDNDDSIKIYYELEKLIDLFRKIED